MKRVISGVKPTGDVTLGNYLGAMKRWGEMSADAGLECLFFVPDLHALNIRPSADELRMKTRSAVAWLLACGVDPDKSVIFKQSDVPAHSELTVILNNYATVGELNRMTQFKDKSRKSGAEGQLVGLYDYPVLMAADILLYDVEEVPVGEDQKQHVELTRDIAERFNNIHGQTFVVPKPTIQATGARIMDLQDPTKKMSKSDAELGGCILLADNVEAISRKIKRAVTDSGTVVEASDDKPAVSNLLAIYSLISGRAVGDIEADYVGRGYGDFKSDLADLVVGAIAPLQGTHDKYMADAAAVDAVLARGREFAQNVAGAKIDAVKQIIGLV